MSAKSTKRVAAKAPQAEEKQPGNETGEKAAILAKAKKAAAELDSGGKSNSAGSVKDQILRKSSPEALGDVEPFDWQEHSRRQEICRQGIWAALGEPFSGFEWRLISVNHPTVQKAISHTESLARRQAGLRGAAATQADPNTPEVLRRMNAAAVLAGTRSLRGRISLGKNEVHEWANEEAKEGNVQRLNEEDRAIWAHMLSESDDLAARAVDQMSRLGRVSDGEIIRLHETGGVYGRDLVVAEG